MKRTGSAVWQGNLKDGKGNLSTQSGALRELPYSFNTRFADQPGTNPEELIGAAHAGCFSMALANLLGEAGFAPDRLETRAEVSLEKQESGFAITAVELTLKARVPGIDQGRFEAITQQAKAGCPVSKLLNARISLNATLED